ncbi:MAG: carbohydrate ABC transporter permease [Schleiferilactobacillus perolens]|uniref:carbohydrate ABC transporter permease n=1 Tax=Schleiferilactobacillus perolens TaxID=100468 RepID=UPI0039E8497E
MQIKTKSIGFILSITIISAFMVIPVYLLAKISISNPSEVLTAHPTFLPHSFNLGSWVDILKSGNLWEPLQRSLITATATTVVAVLLVAPASYAISRMSSKIKFLYIGSLFITRMFPPIGIALPTAITFTKWGLIDTNRGLVMAELIGQIPFLAWILLSTFNTIPRDLEEAAYMDGAGRIKTLIKIVLPVSMQGIAVGALYVWLNCWNEFTYALYLSIQNRTLPLGVYYYIQRGGFFETAAYSTVLTIPVIIITFFLQKYLKSEYLSGAIK